MKRIMVFAVIFLVATLATTLSAGEGDKPSPIDGMLPYLLRYWGPEYPKNLQRFFLGDEKVIEFITPQAMMQMLEHLCKLHPAHCSLHPENILGKHVLVNGKSRVYVAFHPDVAPWIYALTILHEVHHMRETDELKTRLFEVEVLGKIFGQSWFEETRESLRLHCSRREGGFLAPTPAAVEVFRQQLGKMGVTVGLEVELNRFAMEDLVFYMVNDPTLLRGVASVSSSVSNR